MDTVGVSFPITAANTAGTVAQVANFGEAGESYRFRRQLEGGGFMAFGAGSVGDVCWVEASLPKREGDDNVEGLTLPEAQDAIRRMVTEAARWCEPDTRLGLAVQDGPGDDGQVDEDRTVWWSADNPKLVRLDLVRDFQLIDPGVLPQLLGGLASVPRPKPWISRVFADGERKGAPTLSVGPKAWRATLYDKHHETGGIAPAGRTRFEVRLHREQLASKFNVNHGGAVVYAVDLHETTLAPVRRAWFDRVGMGREVVAMDALVDRVERSGLSPAQQVAFLGWCEKVRRGRPAGLSSNTERRYRQVAANLGLVLTVGADEAPAALVRLDFDSGTEAVVIPAA